jgi:hypothetical protein
MDGDKETLPFLILGPRGVFTVNKKAFHKKVFKP